MCVRDLLVIVKSHGQHTYLQRIIKSSKPELYEKASLSSQFYAANILFQCILWKGFSDKILCVQFSFCFLRFYFINNVVVSCELPNLTAWINGGC